MSIALSELWTRLVRSGITDAGGCKQFANEFCKANKGTPAGDANSLAAFLVQTKKITDFQSRALLADSPPQIRHGGFVQTTDRPSMPLGHWLPVKTVVGLDVNFQPGWGGRSGFLLRVPVAQATESISQWLAAHAAVSDEALQPIELYGTPGSDREVFSPLNKGRSLNDLTTKKMKVSRNQALSISIAIAKSLSALHARSLVHGEVRADRVWMTTAGQAILLRDPSGPPRVPRADPALSWIHAQESAGGYAAPEFANPNQVCTAATDIYSLGCLMFRMFVGRMPMDQDFGNASGSIEAEIAVHAALVPPELTQAIEQGETGDPVLRVIAYAMAKNPAARFASAQQVADALVAVQASLSSKPAGKTIAERTKESAVEPIPVKPPPAEKQSRKAAKTKESPAKTMPVGSTESTPASSLDAVAPAVAPPVVKDTVRAETASTVPIQEPANKKKSKPKESTATTASASALEITPVAVPPIAEQDLAPAHASVQAPPAVPPPPPPEAPTNAETEQETQSEPARVRRRRRKKNNMPFVLGMLSIPVLATFIMLVARGTAGPEPREKKSRPPIPTIVPPVASSTRDINKKGPSSNSSSPEQVAGYQVVSDGKFPWVPPYAADSERASLSLLPPGPAAVISVRLNSVITDPAGRQLIEALSPELSGLIKLAADRARVPVTSIKHLSVALHPYQDGWPQASLAIELMEPKSAKALADVWQVSSGRTPEGVTIYAGEERDSDAFYLGDSQKGAMAPDAMVSRFAVGAIEKIKAVAEIEGNEIPLSPAMQKLWDTTSQDADLVVLVTPNFLFADGREMLNSFAPELVAPMKRVLITDFAGVLVSATANENTVYTEVKAVPSGGLSSAALMRKLSDAFQTWPAWANKFSVDAVPDRSWRLLANRLPQMIRFLVDQTRLGVEDDVVIANAYLPAAATSQLSIATLLALNTPPGTAAVATADASTTPLMVDQMLDRKMSVSFDQESLEFAIDAIVGDFTESLPAGSTMPEVRIIGSDLEKMGITQNQQVRDFKKKDIPLRTVLTDLVLGANPDKTATGPDDPKQSLVWVVHQEGGKPVILVTTRVAADGKYELPSEFQADN
ncbi:MAG: protein kinase [Pirellulaceae bacterium]